MSVLLTLPPHLIEKIEAILDADLQDARSLDEETQRGLRKARDDHRGWKPPTALTAQTSKLTDGTTGSNDDASSTVVIVGTELAVDDPPAPPTVDEEVLVSLSRWAGTDLGQVILKRNHIDPLEYSMISLLAGTEVYIPPSQLARLRAADNPDKPNPFLPSYLSPKPPSLGSEYRNLTRQLTTALNILFSIFGSAFAVYAAGVSGAGYSRETATLLAILAGGVVGVADGVLVWIFSERVKKGREEAGRLTRKMGAGMTKGDREGGKEDDDVEEEGGVKRENEPMSVELSETKPEIRLRRRVLGGSNGRVGPTV